jgi:ABC-type molybdate transport system substrate-binding protein
MRASLTWAALAIALLLARPAWADGPPLRLFAAGSLGAAMTDMLTHSGIPASDIAPPVFGPSGVLRGRIDAGEAADILASADMTQPRRLAQTHPGRPVILFARNHMCMLARQKLALTPVSMLSRMLDPKIRLATSTPGADPGGDYAWAVFARAEKLRHGAQAALQAKALTLVGGPDSKPLVAGHGQVAGVFLAGRADMMLGYCSGTDEVLRDVPGLVSVPLPANLTVDPAYGMVVLTNNPAAAQFALFTMSEAGQTILARHGFMAVGDGGVAQ